MFVPVCAHWLLRVPYPLTNWETVVASNAHIWTPQNALMFQIPDAKMEDIHKPL